MAKTVICELSARNRYIYRKDMGKRAIERDVCQTRPKDAQERGIEKARAEAADATRQGIIRASQSSKLTPAEMDDQISHDDVTHFLRQPHYIGQTLWKTVKPLVRKHQTCQGVLVVDDSLVHEPHSQETGLVSTYFDHTSNQYVKAINFLILLYRVEDIRLSVDLYLVIRYLQCQFKDRKEVWKALQTKNEAFRELLQQKNLLSITDLA